MVTKSSGGAGRHKVGRRKRLPHPFDTKEGKRKHYYKRGGGGGGAPKGGRANAPPPPLRQQSGTGAFACQPAGLFEFTPRTRSLERTPAAKTAGATTTAGHSLGTRITISLPCLKPPNSFLPTARSPRSG